MKPDKYLRLPEVWSFVPLKTSHGIAWVWHVRDHQGHLLRQSSPFESIIDCKNDALACGYIPPEARP